MQPQTGPRSPIQPHTATYSSLQLHTAPYSPIQPVTSPCSPKYSAIQLEAGPAAISIPMQGPTAPYNPGHQSSACPRFEGGKVLISGWRWSDGKERDFWVSVSEWWRVAWRQLFKGQDSNSNYLLKHSHLQKYIDDNFKKIYDMKDNHPILSIQMFSKAGK